MADYSQFAEEASPEQTNQLGRLCAQADALATEIKQIELKLKEKVEQKRVVVETNIPELMQAMNCKEIVTADGLRVELREEVRASFPSRDKAPEKREEAFRWLTENGHVDLIKHNLTLKFTKGEREVADKIVAILKEARTEDDKPFQLNMDRDDSVHPQTLLAFLRERLREGDEIPLDKFGAFVQKFAKITRDK